MQRKENEITKGKVIFVEGRDEELFFNALIRKIGLADEYQIVGFGGKDSMNDTISMLSKTTGFLENVISISIIRDCDKNYESTSGEIKYTLEKVFGIKNITELQFVNSPQNDIKCGYFIMPGDRRIGELEDLVIQSINGNVIHNEITEYLEKIRQLTKPSVQDSNFTYPRKESKALLQIYFSSMKESDTRLGISAERNYVNFEEPAFESIKEFISSM